MDLDYYQHRSNHYFYFRCRSIVAPIFIFIVVVLLHLFHSHGRCIVAAEVAKRVMGELQAWFDELTALEKQVEGLKKVRVCVCIVLVLVVILLVKSLYPLYIFFLSYF